jgi:pyruvate/2-oxoglutarate dehydrogenase complex dihydrolipoamide dehydrogenase (E3) component
LKNLLVLTGIYHLHLKKAEPKKNETMRDSNETLIQPLDQHNLKLLSQVHPQDYQNPVPKGRYHLVVIGAGPAGLVTAAAAAGLGAKVALVERHLMGGDCLNVGCVPSKGLIRAARSWHETRKSYEEFGGPKASGKGDFEKAVSRMRRIRAELAHVDSVDRYQELGVDVFIGEGRFLDQETIGVGDLKLKFRKAVIATGARASLPPVPGLKEAKPLTNETLFWLTKPPRRLGVIGAGPMGCEMAQAFARFGSEVTVFEQGSHALIREDQDAAEIVQKQLFKDGVKFIFECNLKPVETKGAEKILNFECHGTTKRVVCDELLVAAGRSANIENLNLGAAGIDFHKSGVTVNDRLQTTNKRVFAAGDVASRYQFTHTADAQARLVVANALFFGRGKAGKMVIPWCTYTQPEIAHVGYYEKDAQEAGFEVQTLTLPFQDLDRAVLDGQNEGFLRVHLKKGSDKILGATLVADHAGDMIGEMAVAITNQLGLSKIGATIHPYPTQGEIFRKIADAYRRTKLTPPVKKIFQIFFRIFS